MKIIIVGGGISGLSNYLFLKKLLPPNLPSDAQLQIVVYESHRAQKAQSRTETSALGPAGFTGGVGGGLGIAPNGLRVLKSLDEDLFQDTVNQAYPVSKFRFRSRQGWSLAHFPTVDAGEPPLPTILTSRQGIWDCLRDRVLDKDIVCKSVAEVIPGNDLQRPRVLFVDGSPDEEADLIVGADGVRSVVKKVVTGDGRSDALPAVYEGLVGIGGFMPSSYLSPTDPSGITTMTFGHNGFFGYGAFSSSHVAGWWSTYSLPTLPTSNNFDKGAIRDNLQARFATWQDPIIQKIIGEVEVDSIYPTWTTPELPTWKASGVVLIGDAAHALQSSSGQGVSQALEDAQALSMLLAEHLRRVDNHTGRPTEALELACKDYCTVRMPRVKRIADHTKQMGDMKREKGVLAEYIMYLFIWIKGKFPLDIYSQWVVNYDLVAEIERFIKAPVKTALQSGQRLT